MVTRRFKMKTPDNDARIAASASQCGRQILAFSSLITLLENADTIEFTPDEMQRHIDILQQVRQMKEFYLKVRTRFAALAQL
jgi:hypothetical protein